MALLDGSRKQKASLKIWQLGWGWGEGTGDAGKGVRGTGCWDKTKNGRGKRARNRKFWGERSPNPTKPQYYYSYPKAAIRNTMRDWSHTGGVLLLSGRNLVLGHSPVHSRTPEIIALVSLSNISVQSPGPHGRFEGGFPHPPMVPKRLAASCCATISQICCLPLV